MLLDHLRKKDSLLIAGIMSGTSLDGIDVAFLEIREEEGRPVWRLRGVAERPYDPEIRRLLLSASSGELPLRRTFELDVELGILYAEAVTDGLKANGILPGELDAVGLHGQTIYHDPPHGVTVQIGSAAVIAEQLSSVVVNDFRTADVAAGGEGAPLVPFCDALLLHKPGSNRVALNIGGMANLTWLPCELDPNRLLAFDTGPGNVLIDAAMRELRGENYDAGGELASVGEVDAELLDLILADPWFAEPPPKSTGRERFGEERGVECARSGKKKGRSDADVIRTLTAVTARSIINAIDRHVAPVASVDEIIVGGGGAKNTILMEMLRTEAAGPEVLPSDRYGVPADAKEAICFAILAWATLHGIPSNVPSVTGARGPRILGTVRRRG